MRLFLFEGIAKTNTTNTNIWTIISLMSLRVLLKQIQQTLQAFSQQPRYSLRVLLKQIQQTHIFAMVEIIAV